MAAPTEAQIQAYVDAQVEARLAQVITDINCVLHIFILRPLVSMDHNGVAVRVCWVWGWAVGKGLGRLSHTSPGPARLPPHTACLVPFAHVAGHPTPKPFSG